MYLYKLCPIPSFSDVYPRQKIRNRWLVAYTLLNNPSLQSLRGSKLKDKDEASTCADAEQGNVLPTVDSARTSIVFIEH